jgi:hypothetical protein
MLSSDLQFSASCRFLLGNTTGVINVYIVLWSIGYLLYESLKASVPFDALFWPYFGLSCLASFLPFSSALGSSSRSYKGEAHEKTYMTPIVVLPVGHILRILIKYRMILCFNRMGSTTVCKPFEAEKGTIIQHKLYRVPGELYSQISKRLWRSHCLKH